MHQPTSFTEAGVSKRGFSEAALFLLPKAFLLWIGSRISFVVITKNVMFLLKFAEKRDQCPENSRVPVAPGGGWRRVWVLLQDCSGKPSPQPLTAFRSFPAPQT